MSKFKYLIGAIFSTIFIACGGNSSKVEVPKAFSIKVQQKNYCEEVTPLSNATILVYDESPGQNAQSEFSTYTTDDDGLLQLDLDKSGQVSFTVIAKPPKIGVFDYSYALSVIDVDVDKYTITMLSGQSAYSDSECTCKSIRVEADVSSQVTQGEYIDYANVYWGNSSKKLADFQIDGSSVVFPDVQICGESARHMPLAVEIWTADGCQDCFKNYILGVVENPDFEKDIVQVQANVLSQELPLPEHLSDYIITHSRYLNGVGYLDDWGATGLRSLDELDLGAHYFHADSTSSSQMTATFNGQQFNDVVASKSRASYQGSSDLSLFGEMPSVNSMAVAFDESTRSFSIDAAGSEHYDLTRVSTSFAGGNNAYTFWTLYTPNTGKGNFPLLTPELEQQLLISGFESQQFSVIDFDTIGGYSESLKRAILNNEDAQPLSHSDLSFTAPKM